MPTDSKDGGDGTPQVRRNFARRLRELRVLSGYKTARSLARTIGIDENRYTRYERAEVEPDLTLLTVLAATLRTTPNDLLGVGNGLAGFQDGGEQPVISREIDLAARASRSDKAKAICWSLATAIADAVGHACGGHSRTAPAHGSSPRLQEVSAVYQQLTDDPFGALSTIVNEPAVCQSPAVLQSRIRGLVEELAQELGDPGSRPAT